MHESEILLAKAIEAVQAKASAFSPVITRDAEAVQFDLPHPNDADYRFEVWMYPDAEPQIAARLVAAPKKYFWYYPFELPDYDSRSHQAECFLAELSRLLVSATSIEERQGFVWRNFVCSLEAGYEQFGGGVSVLAPAITRYKRRYRSRALVRAEP